MQTGNAGALGILVLLGAILLAASRAIGETMIVVLGAGAIAKFSVNPLESMTTITTRIVSQLTGDGAKFDVSWFIPAIIKFRHMFSEVLVASFFIQVLALISPLLRPRVLTRA